MRKAKLPRVFRWKRNVIYIQKVVYGRRVSKSTGTGSLRDAEQYLARVSEALRQEVILGKRCEFTFREAATRYLNENRHLSSIPDNANHLERLGAFVGHLGLKDIHNRTLAPHLDAEQQRVGRNDHRMRPKSINNALQVVRRVLNLSAWVWRDSNGHPWLEGAPPLITMLPVNATNSARPYPLDWDEQTRLLAVLPKWLADMSLFALNTGCREQEVCQLDRSWYRQSGDIGLFYLPAQATKSRRERVVVLNTVARNVICAVQSQGRVFGERPAVHVRSWITAWRRAGLPVSRQWTRGVHNLRHTFGRRLRAAGVVLETRKALLGHAVADLTTHYSAAELHELVDAAETVTQRTEGRVLRAVQSAPKMSHAI